MFKINFKSFLVALLLTVGIFSFFFIPAIAVYSADSPGLVPCGVDPNDECGFDHIFRLINNVINFISINMVLPLAAIMFAYAGFLLVTSGGSSEKKSKATKIFTHVAIGLVIFLGAFLIVQGVLKLAGYNTEINWFGF